MTPERLRDLGATATQLRAELASVRFPFVAPAGDGEASQGLDAHAAADDAAAIVRQLDDHVLARVAHLDAPALVVVGGSTGAGKSLLVNSLVGADVTRPGVLRPTTTAPSLIHGPGAAAWFGSRAILPNLARVHDGEAHGHAEVRIVEASTLPEGIALLDSPDIDSVSVANRELAAELLAAADLWIFVTTASRYADAVPWAFLTRARAQGTPLVVVMNRAPAEHEATLREHLDSMLTDHGLGGTTVLVISEQPLDGTRLPPTAVAGLRSWIDHLGVDRDARARAIEASLRGSLRDVANRVDAVGDAVQRQCDVADTLRNRAHLAYEAASRQIRDDISHGAMLRGEVLARWEELLGTGELLRQLRTGVSRARDRVVGALTGRERHEEAKLGDAVEHTVETLIRTRGDEAASQAVASWRADPAGAKLLAGPGTEQLGQSSTTLGADAALTVRAWQVALLERVRNVGSDRKSKARFLSFGVNGVALVVMVLVFAHTGGLTGAEVAVAGGASAVGHALLEAVLGDQTVRTLALDARTDLESRIDTLFSAEAERFDRVLVEAQAGGVDVDAPARLRLLLTEIRKAIR